MSEVPLYLKLTHPGRGLTGWQRGTCIHGDRVATHSPLSSSLSLSLALSVPLYWQSSEGEAGAREEAAARGETERDRGGETVRDKGGETARDRDRDRQDSASRETSPSTSPRRWRLLHYLHTNPTSYTLHPTPYTLHPAPCTLHPKNKPSTLHPTPYTNAHKKTPPPRTLQ